MIVDVGSEIVSTHSKSMEKGMTEYYFDKLQLKAAL